MVSHGRVELLAHPLSQKYLQMKWNSYGKYYHVANLLIYCVFLVFVTLYSSLLMNNVFDVQQPTGLQGEMGIINSTENASSVLDNVNYTFNKVILKYLIICSLDFNHSNTNIGSQSFIDISETSSRSFTP